MYLCITTMIIRFNNNNTDQIKEFASLTIYARLLNNNNIINMQTAAVMYQTKEE